MLNIKLTQGYEAIVDPVDFENYCHFSWHILKARNLIYAARTSGKQQITLHHAVATNMGLDLPHAKVIGFINGNGLDCRRDNIYLRDKKIRINTHKSYIDRSNYKNYRGVYQNPCGSYRVKFNRTHIGTFSSEIEAAIAYDEFAFKKYGAEAILNFGV
tara:strand:+ start:425 stop:898 length:474 start_codon:yes stop_codon:yes gene_type:complete